MGDGQCTQKGEKMIIEIEGVDGIGKTTQCKLLKNWFGERNKPSIIVKDLESTHLGREMKAIFTSDVPRTKEVELFGFLCCKAHLFAEIITPNVNHGTHVICDRGIGSFLSYFEVEGFDPNFLKEILAKVLPEKFTPVTFLLFCDIRETLRRNVIKPSHSKFDNMGSEFFEKQQNVYKRLAKTNDWKIIDASDSIENVHALITLSIENLQ